MSRRLGVGLVTAAALCWSSGGLIARLAGTDAWTTIFWRSVFCAAFLSGAVLLTQRGHLSDIVRQAGWPGFGMAACFAIASTAFIMALSRTSVANTLIIQSLSPFIAGLLGWLCLGEHVRRRTWLAMAIALVGTVVMLGGSPGGGSRIGDALALVTATFFAGATVLVRWHRGVYMPAAAALAAALAALLALFGIGQLGVGMLCFTAGARLIPVAEASLIGVLECVLGPVWVWLAIGERPGAYAMMGGAVILGALVAHTAADLAESRRPALDQVR